MSINNTNEDCISYIRDQISSFGNFKILEIYAGYFKYKTYFISVKFYNKIKIYPLLEK